MKKLAIMVLLASFTIACTNKGIEENDYENGIELIDKENYEVPPNGTQAIDKENYEVPKNG